MISNVSGIDKSTSIVACPEDIRTIFQDSGEHLKAPDMNSGWVTGELMGKCLGLANQVDWSRIRAAMAEPFHQRTAPAYISLIQDRIEKKMTALERQNLKAKSTNQMIIDPAEELLYLPFYVLGDILYGGLDESMECELRDIAALRDTLWKGAMTGGMARFSIGRFNPASKLRQDVNLFHRQWREFNEKARVRAKSINTADAPIATMYQAMERGQLSEDELLHTLDEILFVNLDVTVGNFSWNPVFLAANPEIQQEIRHEIRQARAGERFDSWKAYISSTSTLLMASILESARLKPMASFAVPQSLPTNRVVGGYVIPDHTEVVVDTCALNIENPRWGADRYEYSPRRFLRENPVAWRYRFWRFGFGPRQCLGKHVVDILLKCLLVYIVEHYQMTPAWIDSKEGHMDWQKKPEVWMNLAQQPIIWQTLEN